MNRPIRNFFCAVGAAALSLGAFSVGTASAASPVQVCSGTPKAPGILTGTYPGDVAIQGACAVNMGVAVVHGNLTVDEGSALVAAFALDDGTGTGTSNLTVFGDITLQQRSAMILGCDPRGFACLDDSNQKHPTLSSHSQVAGSIIGDKALGLIVHNDTIAKNISLTGGGGGENCDPVGIFKAFQSPAFTAIEDGTVDGDVAINGVRSCWLGVNEMQVGGDVTIRNNHLADPDAIEILANHITGALDCRADSAAWDNSETGPRLFPRQPQPNTVLGGRHGMCRLASPTTKGGSPGPGPF